MLRRVVTLAAGAIFGTGLLLSGMTDTVKVQGWLDVFGNWDPTLAFVMGGAILPMAVAWRVVARWNTALLGDPLPTRPDPRLGHNLVVGSVLFGAGWGLAGLCPGPALASLSFGGTGGVVFLAAMLAGMVAAPRIRAAIDRWAATGDIMNFRTLTPTYTTSPQITPADLPLLKAAGYTRIICNRPDGEVPADLQAGAMRAAAEAAGLEFVLNPVIGGALTTENVAAQRAAIDGATGPIFAYCASGNRSSVVWALANAGRMPTDEMIRRAREFGYNLEPYRAQIDTLAAS